MKYIQLTKYDGELVYVNIEHITAVTVTPTFGYVTGSNTTIYTLDGKSGWSVKESVSEVMDKIDEVSE